MRQKPIKNKSIAKRAIILGGLLLAVAVWVIINFDNNSTMSTKPSETVTNADSKIQPSTSPILVIGNPDAKVTIIEYADYKCPECGKYHQSAGKQIRKDYIDTGLVKVVFRPYPVYSEDGAKALAGSYCANNQGKFKEYHDSIFEYMWVNHFEKGDYQKAIDPVLTDSVMGDLLKNSGINKEAYDICLASKDTRKVYDDDIDLAAPDEIQGTPSFIIGGQKIVGPQPYRVFKTLLDIQLR